MEYEGGGSLGFAAALTQSLRCYDFAPAVEAYAEKHFTPKGVGKTVIECFVLSIEDGII